MADDGGRICAYDVETVQQYIRYAELRDKVQFFDRQAAKDLLAEVSTLTCVKLQLNWQCQMKLVYMTPTTTGTISQGAFTRIVDQTDQVWWRLSNTEWYLCLSTLLGESANKMSMRWYVNLDLRICSLDWVQPKLGGFICYRSFHRWLIMSHCLMKMSMLWAGRQNVNWSSRLCTSLRPQCAWVFQHCLEVTSQPIWQIAWLLV